MEAREHQFVRHATTATAKKKADALKIKKNRNKVVD